MAPDFAVSGTWVKNAVTGVEFKAWVVGILGVMLVLLLTKKHFLRRKLPPGPRNWPLVGAIFSMDTDLQLAQWFTKLAKKFGPIVYYRLGSHGIIVVSSVEGTKEVLKTKDSEFADRPQTTLTRSAAKYLGFEAQDILYASYNDDVKMLKKLCATAFFTASKLAIYEDLRRQEGAFMVEEIHRGRSDNGGTKNVIIRESLHTMTSNVQCMLLFGKRDSDDILSEIITRYTELLQKFNVMDFFPWLERLDPQGLGTQYKDFQRLSRSWLGQIIEEHRHERTKVANYEDRDFVDLLLTLHENGKITEDGILGCIIDMLVGGTETSTSMTEWAFFELVKRPEILRKLQKELDEVVGSDRPIEESDFANMPYFQAVIKETFRLHTPAPFAAPHFNKSASSLGGYFVPANTTVILNLYSVSRDPLLWEDPEEFKPERFMGPSHADIVNLTGSSYKLLPFGTGRRMCPGYSLGLLFVQRAVATLVHAFEWSLPPGVAADDVSAVHRSLSIQLQIPLLLTATPRLAPAVYCNGVALYNKVK